MDVKTAPTSGHYGEIVEHPLIHGLKYMVLGLSRVTKDVTGSREYRHYSAVVISEGDIGKKEVGQVVEIGEGDWIIHE